MATRGERRVGIRELKARLSECVREVKSGATIVVTDHGRRVARLVPETPSLEDRLDTLKKTGAIQWSGHRLSATPPDVRPQSKLTVADIVIESRR
jgi:prevent-host-death family protein